MHAQREGWVCGAPLSGGVHMHLMTSFSDGLGIVLGFQLQREQRKIRKISKEVQHGNYIQSLGTDHDGRKCKKRNVCMCMAESLCCAAEVGTTL